ncbi:contractile injection system tape measure protein [Vibrio variabilis]|uniref:contractile injection system tape measure protein n=1 Tax=Vibrio variabilis TaxID=990271 RepID=UPI0013A6B12F|nr:contractile injection system tape measure protein [Vibrio variabilis]
MAIPTHSPLEDSGVERVLLENRQRLSQALSQSNRPNKVLGRMTQQLSSATLAALLPALNQAQRRALMAMLLQRQHLEPELQSVLRQNWQTQIVDAIQARRLDPIMAFWDPLLSRYHLAVVEALYQQAHNASLPVLLVDSLSVKQRLALFHRLEPLEYPFLHQLLSAPELWMQSEQQPHYREASSSSEVPAFLWQFTFHFVLVERGSRFNKQQYMLGLVGHMAAERNLDIQTLIAELRYHLSSTHVDGSLRQQMLRMLDEFALDDETYSVNRKEPTDNVVTADLIHRLKSMGSSSSMLPLLEKILNDESSSKELYRQFNVDVDLQQALWSSLPNEWIERLIEVFNHVQRDVIEALPIASPAEIRESKSSLKHKWEALTKQQPKTQTFHHRLLIALKSGNENSLKQAWPDNPNTLKSLLLWSGQLAAVRRHWVDSYSNTTLMTFTEVIEPAALPIVSQIFSEQETIRRSLHELTPPAPIDANTLRDSLWEFTFSYLLVERGSEFNNLSYLQSLTEQMAARRNVEHEVLVTSLLTLFSASSSSGASHVLSKALLTISSQFNQPSPQGVKSKTNELAALSELNTHALQLWLEVTKQFTHFSPQFWVALLNGEPKVIQSFVEQTHIKSNSENGQSQRLISALMATPTVQQRWLVKMSDQDLLALFAWLNPKRQAIQPLLSLVLTLQIHKAELRSLGVSVGLIETKVLIWQPLLSLPSNFRGQQAILESALHTLISSIAKRSLKHESDIADKLLSLDGFSCEQHRHTWLSRSLNRLSSKQLSRKVIEQWVADIQSENSTTAWTSEQKQRLIETLTNRTVDTSRAQLKPDSRTIRRIIKRLQITKPISLDLPLVCDLIAAFDIPVTWLYQQLLGSNPPQTSREWFSVIVRQIQNQHPTTKEQTLYEQLATWLKSQKPPRYQDWLDSIPTPPSVPQLIENLLTKDHTKQAISSLQQAIDSAPRTLSQQLTNVLQSREKLEHWIDSLTSATHLALVIKLNPNLYALVPLYQALMSHANQSQRIHVVFWKLVYQRVVLMGAFANPSQTLSWLVAELCHAPEVQQQFQLKSAESLPFLSKLELSDSLLQVKNRLSVRHATSGSNSSKKQPYSESTPIIQPQNVDANHPEVASINQALALPREQHLNTAVKATANDEVENESLNWPYKKDDVEYAEPITVTNAGLVIASTYIPALFQRLSLTNNQGFVSEETQVQALFCLQYLVEGVSEAPEYLLVLNKILCGMDIQQPIPTDVELPDNAKQTIDGLLTAMIAHWSAIGTTSIEGLRTTFLQREGYLTKEDNQWQLQVIPGTFDVLLDQLPWSFQTIKYPWMDQPLFVTWR